MDQVRANSGLDSSNSWGDGGSSLEGGFILAASDEQIPHAQTDTL